MRRVMLLTLLTLALSTAALANQIRYNTGFPATQANVTMTTFATNPFTVDVVCPTCSPVAGQISPVEMSLTTTSIIGDCSSSCTFMDGTATVEALGGGELFTDTVSNGQIIAGSIISADLDPATFNTAGGSVHFGITSDSTTQALVGNGSMILDGVIPEPGTLSLLGTGLICLGGMAIRKLKLGT